MITAIRKKKNVVSEISRTLKACYPEIYFGIKSSVKGYKQVVTVSYFDGVNVTKVRNVLRRFENSYCKIKIEREMSTYVRTQIMEETRMVFGLENPTNTFQVLSVGCTLGKYISMIFNMRDF